MRKFSSNVGISEIFLLLFPLQLFLPKGEVPLLRNVFFYYSFETHFFKKKLIFPKITEHSSPPPHFWGTSIKNFCIMKKNSTISFSIFYAIFILIIFFYNLHLKIKISFFFVLKKLNLIWSLLKILRWIFGEFFFMEIVSIVGKGKLIMIHRLELPDEMRKIVSFLGISPKLSKVRRSSLDFVWKFLKIF